MATLTTVQDYLNRARSLLLDTTPPYRYSDEDLVHSLNMGVLEARRIRPDLLRSFFRATDGLPEFDPGALSVEVELEEMYRPSFVYYMVGQMQLRDEEDVSDARAAAFLNKFVSQLLVTQS